MCNEKTSCLLLLSEQINKVYEHIVKDIQLLIGIRRWCLVHVHCYEFLIRLSKSKNFDDSHGEIS